MADKSQIAKTAGIAYLFKKVLGGVLKLAVVGAVGAAVVKVLRREPS